MLNDKMTRREFLKVCLRTVGAIALWSMMPFNITVAGDNTGTKRFRIRVKPLNLRDLLRPHPWAG